MCLHGLHGHYSPPFQLLLDLLAEVDDSKSAAMLAADGVRFRLHKVRCNPGRNTWCQARLHVLRAASWEHAARPGRPSASLPTCSCCILRCPGLGGRLTCEGLPKEPLCAQRNASIDRAYARLEQACKDCLERRQKNGR